MFQIFMGNSETKQQNYTPFNLRLKFIFFKLIFFFLFSNFHFFSVSVDPFSIL